jgi:TfoX/Sxy family transcriptional regulator of competence genes
MAFDETLAQRLRIALAEEDHVVEKKMFGGIAFMVRGNMTVGIIKDELLVRVGPDAQGKALSKPFSRMMDFTGKPMMGFIYVAAPGINTLAKLKAWVKMGLDFTLSLPERSPKSKNAIEKNKARKKANAALRASRIKKPLS